MESWKRGEEKKFFEEIMAENFPNLIRNMNLHIQELHRGPNRVNLKRFTSRYIIMKLLRDKGKKP